MAAHLEPAYEGTAHVPLPVTELLTERSLILPLHHELTAEQQVLVIDTLTAAIGADAVAAV
jgi:dTDP-4-amino-4,6-dideoxygalactose transaminase